MKPRVPMERAVLLTLLEWCVTELKFKNQEIADWKAAKPTWGWDFGVGRDKTVYSCEHGNFGTPCETCSALDVTATTTEKTK